MMNESWGFIQTEARKSVTRAGVFQSDKSLLRSAGLFQISLSVSGSRGRQSGRSGGLQVALNDFVKLNVCLIMPLCKKSGQNVIIQPNKCSAWLCYGV